MAWARVTLAAAIILLPSRYERAGCGGPMCTASWAKRVAIVPASASEKTETEEMPNRWHVRTTLQAISPRLATSKRVIVSTEGEEEGTEESMWKKSGWMEVCPMRQINETNKFCLARCETFFCLTRQASGCPNSQVYFCWHKQFFSDPLDWVTWIRRVLLGPSKTRLC